MKTQGYKAIVMGASVGGTKAIRSCLAPLPASFPLPIIIVQHLHSSDRGRLAQHLDGEVALSVCSASDKEKIVSGRVYFAPANYHLFVERDETLALSLDPPVNWSRPSIDILFESASRVWRERLVGVVLTGSMADGARGMRAVAERGGLTVVQDPETAYNSEMILAVMKKTAIDHVIPLSFMGEFLSKLSYGAVTSWNDGENSGKESCL